jgi:hypothetical protein
MPSPELASVAPGMIPPPAQPQALPLAPPLRRALEDAGPGPPGPDRLRAPHGPVRRFPKDRRYGGAG